MARSGHWSLAVLVLFAFLIVFFLPGFPPKAIKGPKGDVLARLLLERRYGVDASTANSTTTNGLYIRALRPIPSAADDVYNRASDKGKLLRCWMKDPSAAGSLGSSKWNDHGALKEWGWIETTTTHHGGERIAGFSDIVGPFDSDDWSNENKIVKFDHHGQHEDQEITKLDGSRVTVSYPVSTELWLDLQRSQRSADRLIVADQCHL